VVEQPAPGQLDPVRQAGNGLPAIYAWPMLVMSLAYLSAFGSLWLVRIRALVWRRKARALALQAAEG
jgi:heme exporter protein C